jgi:uncharacterized RDD family membrane protein YckC
VRTSSEVGDALDVTADVETPEHVRFRHRVAGPARRALAYTIDLTIRGGIAIVFIALLLAGSTRADEIENASSGVVLLVAFALEWGYYVLFDTLWGGRTPGRRALSLRVIKEGGQAITFLDSVLRNLLRAADFLPAGYALGVAVMARDRRFRRLGDLVAGTMVIVEERARVAAPLRIWPPPTPEELARVPARPPLDADDLEAIELFLRRSGSLSTLREEELAGMVAPLYARRMGIDVGDAPRLLALLYHRTASRPRGRGR